MTRRLALPACPLCDETAAVPWLTARGFRLVRCAACGHRYATERLPPDELAGGYYGEAAADLRARVSSEKAARLDEYDALLRRADPESSGSESSGPESGGLCARGPDGAVRRVLDVGCNTGELLALLKARGLAVAGVEVSAGAAEVAEQRLGVPIAPSLEALPEEPRFDLITLTHVLEHVAEPRALLGSLRRRLRPGGRLLVEVPCADDPLLGLMGGAYRPLCPGDHVSFFDADGLRRVLSAAGYTLRGLSSPIHARDLVYPALLSSLDTLRALGPRPQDGAGVSGVGAQVRYRGRLRRPLRRLLDGACALLDPLVVRLMARRSAAQRGSVLIAIAS
ncbi:MAG: class I SAM-dependent methyltransferase [Polyangia bacterium]